MPRPTSWLLIPFGAATLALGRLFGLVELYVVGVSMPVALVLAMIIVRRPLGLVVRRSVNPARPCAGESAWVEVSIEAIRKSPLCRIRDANDSGPSAEIDVAPLQLGNTTHTRYGLPVRRRGVVTIGPATVEITDPLGLASRRAVVADRQQVVVLPRWTRVELPRLGSTEGDLTSSLARSLARSGRSDEFTGVREYAPGDDPRRINWKATARGDIPLVNTYDAHSDVETLVLFDTSSAAYDDETFETAVSVVTSLVLSSADPASGRDHRIRLLMSGSDGDVGEVDDIGVGGVEVGPHNRDELSVRMAVIERSLSGISPLAPATPRPGTEVPGPGGSLRAAVVVTADGDHEWSGIARRSLGGLDAVVLVNVGRGASRRPGPLTLNLTDFDDFAAAWFRLVRNRTGGPT